MAAMNMVAENGTIVYRPAEDLFRVTASDGTDLGYAVDYAEACEYLDAWAAQRAEEAAALAGLCGVPLAFIEEEAQRRTELLAGESCSESKEEAAYTKRRLNALNKALMYALQGVTMYETMGDYLIASASNAGTVHRVSQRYGCSCQAGQHNQPCWHSELVDLLQAWRDEQGKAA